MDNIPEKEQPKHPERTVSLGEEFNLFDPKRVKITKITKQSNCEWFRSSSTFGSRKTQPNSGEVCDGGGGAE